MTYSSRLSGRAKDSLWRTWCSDGFPGTPLLCITLTTLMALCPGQILPAVVESWLMGYAGLGERAREVVPNCFKKQHLPRLTSGLASAGNVGWKTAGKQQSGVSGGASKQK